MKGNFMSQSKEYVLNESFKALLETIFSNPEQSKRLIQAFEEVVNDRATTQRINFESLKAKALDEVRAELATKDLLTAETNGIEARIEAEVAKIDAKISKMEAKLEAKIETNRSELKKINQKITFATIGISALIILFQPRVFDFIINFLK